MAISNCFSIHSTVITINKSDHSSTQCQIFATICSVIQLHDIQLISHLYFRESVKQVLFKLKLFKSYLSSFPKSHNGILILCRIHTYSWGKTCVLEGFLKHLFSTSSKSALEIICFLLGSIFSFGCSFLILN